MTTDWHAALTFVVLGTALAGEPTDQPDVAAALASLEPRRAEVIERRRAALAAGEPWPALLPDGLRATIPSQAQFLAARQQLIEALDVERHPSAPHRPLDADERRLIADRPPHFGRVG